MRIWVYVEGTSDKLGLEALFRNETSDWRKRGTSVQLRPLNGKGNILREVGRHARLALDNGRVDHVFVLVDLYPGHTEAEALRQELRALIAPRLRSRFHAHVAVHDFEAWVLAAPEALCARLGVKHLSGFNSPETVNDQKPPAEHLKELFARYNRTYKKNSDGPAILRRTMPAVIADKCSNFRLFYQDLLTCVAEP